jgi:WD40 repeat protein
MSGRLSLLGIWIAGAAAGIPCLMQPAATAQAQSANSSNVQPKNDPPAKELEKVFQGHGASVTAVAYSPDHRRLASLGDFAHVVRIWDVKTGKEVKQLAIQRNGCVELMFSPDCAKILSRNFDGVWLWDVASGKEVTRLESILIGGMGFSAKNSAVVVAGDPGPRPVGQPLPLAVKQVASGKTLTKLDWKSDKMPRLTLSPECTRALAIQHREIPVPNQPGARQAVADPTVRLFDLESGKEILQLKGPESRHLHAAIAPDHTRTLVGGDRGSLWLFDLKTGKKIRQLEGHTGSITAVTFSLDSQRALSGSDDKTMRLWDVQSGKQLAVFQTPGMTTVSCVAFSPSNDKAVSGSYDRTVRLWNLPQ